MKIKFLIMTLLLALSLVAVGCSSETSSITASVPTDNNNNNGGTDPGVTPSDADFELVGMASAKEASGVSPVTAYIKVSSGNEYDYVKLGQAEGATDGFDRGKDAYSPGQGMNDKYVLAYFDHSDWSSVSNQYRGDIRSMASTHEWVITVDTNNASGSTMKVELMSDKQNQIGERYDLSLEDMTTGAVTNIKRSSYSFTTTGSRRQFRVTMSESPYYVASTYTVSGQVWDNNANAAVAGASVVISAGAYSLSTTTDAGGWFSFAGMAEGNYTITATEGSESLLSTSYQVK